MGLDDKADAKKDQVVGGAKEKLGNATGNDSMRAEGAAQEKTGDAKSGVEKIKDAAKDIFGGDKK
ncbi:CsbD family protein [Epidermidibacterium keratini]|uniref:CsbD family protein n=1 Tax=Epidermidibacterium keratini TaxID=1891644 RepID=A0A7L4YKE4_9ACTN|nr:CsbD family protein [Epidermidibacterium keratini]QHB99589.1 CsbD family protein [Epidermidibacterium keratini]